MHFWHYLQFIDAPEDDTLPTRTRRDARYGMRAVRVGEAMHPGPRCSVRRANGSAANISLSCSGGSFVWQFTSAPRLSGPKRATAKLALVAWLALHSDSVDSASAELLNSWEPASSDTQQADLAAADSISPSEAEALTPVGPGPSATLLDDEDLEATAMDPETPRDTADGGTELDESQVADGSAAGSASSRPLPATPVVLEALRHVALPVPLEPAAAPARAAAAVPHPLNDFSAQNWAFFGTRWIC